MNLSPEQERLACTALVGLGPLETELGLHAEGVRAIQEALHCSVDDARGALNQLRISRKIEETTTPKAQNQSPHFQWVQPAGHNK